MMVVMTMLVHAKLVVEEEQVGPEARDHQQHDSEQDEHIFALALSETCRFAGRNGGIFPSAQRTPLNVRTSKRTPRACTRRRFSCRA